MSTEDKAKAVCSAPGKPGPYIVTNCEVFRDGKCVGGADGKTVALCACGQSKNKPFCDGAHTKLAAETW